MLQARFRCGSLRSLASPRAVTRWLILQKARRHTAHGCSGRLRARGFRRCFTPLAGCFSPFPHGTRSLSVAGECSALEGGPPCFPPGFTCPAVLRCRARGGRGFAYGALTRCGRPSHAVPLPRPFVTAPGAPGPRDAQPSTPGGQRPGAVCTRRVWAGALSLAATRAISVDFSSSGYLDVSVPPVAPLPPMDSAGGYASMTSRGLPHSEIRGSKAVSASPRLIAAGRVLHRLPAPRHPPRAHVILAPHRDRRARAQPYDGMRRK